MKIAFEIQIGKTMKNRKINNDCVSIIAIIIAIGSVITTLCIRCNDGWNFDLYGALIGILSLLVTLLLGWQIFQSITIRKEINREFDKKMAELQDGLDKKVHRLKSHALFIEALHFTETRPIYSYYTYMKAMYYLTICGDTDSIGGCLSNMESITRRKPVDLGPPDDPNLDMNGEIDGVKPFEFLEKNLTPSHWARLSRIKYLTGLDLLKAMRANNNVDSKTQN